MVVITFEEKLALLDNIKDRCERLAAKIRRDRIREGKCPHENLQNITTLADPPGVTKYRCKDCREVIVKERGIKK